MSLRPFWLKLPPDTELLPTLGRREDQLERFPAIRAKDTQLWPAILIHPLTSCESIARQDRHDGRLRVAAGDMNATLPVDVNIDLAAHAELQQIDTRLDRKAGTRQHAPFLARLQVVHVLRVAMCLLPDRMAGAMTEILAVAGLFDDLSRVGIVHLPALQRLVGRVGLPNPGDGRVAAHALI